MATEGLGGNFYLVNAPAGSGKTTEIRRRILDHLIQSPDDNILCITYTNRAAIELGRGMESDNVFFGTIHSYINYLVKDLFQHPKVIEFYCKLYKQEIEERIQDPKKKESNDKYKEKYNIVDELNYQVIASNITKIYYNELRNMSLFYGGLSHDELIRFTRRLFERYPVLRNKISKKYQLIYIDEYQDTSDDVLHLFYDAMKDSQGKLYLFGDRMQQIYENYQGSFEKQFAEFDTSERLDINYRCSPKIIDILNKLYNNSSYIQKVSGQNSNIETIPNVIFVDGEKGIEEKVAELKSNIPSTLELYLRNEDRFNSVGLSELYTALSSMDEYGYSKKHSAKDILTTLDDNPDDLISSLLEIYDLLEQFKNGKFGDVILRLKNNKIFDNHTVTVRVHADKEKIKNVLVRNQGLFNQDISIGEYLNHGENILLNKIFFNELLDSINYEAVLKTKIRNIPILYKYIENKDVSTQHGVKGESHLSVIFIASGVTDKNGNRKEHRQKPFVYIFDFFKLLATTDIDLISFEQFYYDYKKMILAIQDMNISEAADYQRQEIQSLITEFISKYREKPYFRIISENFTQYESKPNKTNLDNCLKLNAVKGVLNAYKIFYVGCSRARENLTIIIEKELVQEFQSELSRKLTNLGFAIS